MPPGSKFGVGVLILLDPCSPVSSFERLPSASSPACCKAFPPPLLPAPPLLVSHGEVFYVALVIDKYLKYFGLKYVVYPTEQQ